MAPANENSKITVEQLLKLKKAERPNAEFWDQFDTSLEKRRLRALVDKPSLWQRWGVPILKASFVLVPATAAFAFSLSYLSDHQSIQPNSFALSGNSATFSDSSIEDGPLESGLVASAKAVEDVPTVRGDNQFVLDVVGASRSESGFKKVHYRSSLLSGSSDSTQYVNNPMMDSSASYRVGPAVIKAGYNF